jgi:hypothetical protein
VGAAAAAAAAAVVHCTAAGVRGDGGDGGDDVQGADLPPPSSLEAACSTALRVECKISSVAPTVALPGGAETEAGHRKMAQHHYTFSMIFIITLILFLDNIHRPAFNFAKRKQLGITLEGRKSKLSTSNTILIYKAIFKPIWTYGIQLWGMASTSNIEILELFQSKALPIKVDALWYVPNTVIRRDPHIPTVTVEIRRYGSQYSARLSVHRNGPIVNLMAQPDNNTRLRRHLPNDVRKRFSV